MLKGKNILVGVTGSIAAYKAAILVRLLVKEGAEVRVLMSELAKEFITPLTLATLSKHPVLVDFFNPENGDWNSHVDLGIWADAYLVAPATANTMAKMANGVADNLLLTTYLSSRCPVFIAPAMDLDMFQHPTTQENIRKLQILGHQIVEPGTGELASGLDGKGRMEEPEQIVQFLSEQLGVEKKKLNDFSGKKILITAGPTYEAIDPVRFIGNHSSGKMGYALAHEIANRGAEVVLVSGPTSLNAVHQNITVVPVTSADEMHQASEKEFTSSDITILTAAVADYKPVTSADSKIKSDRDTMTLELTQTIDIAKDLGAKKTESQLIVGFALETDQEEVNARKKLNSKNLDFIVLNSLRDKGAGFKYDTNKISIIDKHNTKTEFELKHKVEVARDIIDKIAEMYL